MIGKLPFPPYAALLQNQAKNNIEEGINDPNQCCTNNNRNQNHCHDTIRNHLISASAPSSVFSVRLFFWHLWYCSFQARLSAGFPFRLTQTEAGINHLFDQYPLLKFAIQWSKPPFLCIVPTLRILYLRTVSSVDIPQRLFRSIVFPCRQTTSFPHSKSDCVLDANHLLRVSLK